jgi:hypothetical protein
MKPKQETDLMSFGDCTFQITTANEMMLSALSKYAQYLDYTTNAAQDEQLNIDGLINRILCASMERWIKELVKQYGFDNSDDFIDVMTHCNDGEEVSVELANHKRIALQKEHDEILSHIPMDSPQRELPFQIVK